MTSPWRCRCRYRLRSKWSVQATECEGLRMSDWPGVTLWSLSAISRVGHGNGCLLRMLNRLHCAPRFGNHRVRRHNLLPALFAYQVKWTKPIFLSTVCILALQCSALISFPFSSFSSLAQAFSIRQGLIQCSCLRATSHINSN